MKITKGKYKGKKIIGFDNPGTRATTSRLYDSLFDTISPYLKDKVVLDLFAGTGRLGITALSLGAKEVVFNDIDKDAFKNIKLNLSNFKNNSLVLNFDYEKAIEYLSFKKSKFDIVFIDPPFSKINIKDIIDLINKNNIVSDDALFIIETDEEIDLDMKLLKKNNFSYKNIYVYKKS